MSRFARWVGGGPVHPLKRRPAATVTCGMSGYRVGAAEVLRSSLDAGPVVAADGGVDVVGDAVGDVAGDAVGGAVGGVGSAPGGRRGGAGAPDVASVFRFATELCAWVATPWALAGWSAWAAAGSVVVLIGLPTLFATPGDKTQVIVPVPGAVTVALVLLQLVAAVAAAWVAWPLWAAATVTALATACLITERRRWGRLLGG